MKTSAKQPQSESPLPAKGLRPAAPPVPTTVLFGREFDVASVRAFILNGQRRLITLTGPGGVGKTRLSLRVAASLGDHFQDGVAFVSLATVFDIASVPRAIGQALAIEGKDERSWQERLVATLHERQMLLVLDNFEQIVDAAPELSTLLAACPKLRILVTSRIRLRVSDEQEFPVSPLPLPDAGTTDAAASPSVALFIERALAARPSLVVDPDNLAAITGICRRLDGLPLAIELAAARTNHLSPVALFNRLERRRPVLTAGPRDAPARHRTMRDAINWSVDLLDPSARAVFARLGIFSGGFTIDAAETVCEATIDDLGMLVEASLVQFNPAADADGEPRYSMLETIREYAVILLETTGEHDALRTRLAAWLTDLNLRVAAEMRGADEAHWLNRLEPELPNLRTTVSWALDRLDPETALRLTTKGVWFLWGVRGIRRDEVHWLERALDLAARDPARVDRNSHGHGLHALGMYHHRIGDFRVARTKIEMGLEYLRETDDLVGVATAIGNLANVAADLGQFDESARLLREAVEIQRGLGEPRLLIIPLLNLGATAISAGDLPGALAAFADAAPVIEQYGNVRDRAYLLTFRGNALILSGRIEEALVDLSEALPVAREADDANATAMSGTYLALARHRSGKSAEALAGLAEPLSLVRQMGQRPFGSLVLDALGEILIDRDHVADGLRMIAASARLREELGASDCRPVDREKLARLIARARRTLGEAGIAAADAAGRSLDFEAATTEGIALTAIPLPDAATTDDAADRGILAALSLREREILPLLVEGLSDREIGDRLSISHRTVSNHVARILAKLGTPTRTAAAALALRERALE